MKKFYYDEWFDSTNVTAEVWVAKDEVVINDLKVFVDVLGLTDLEVSSQLKSKYIDFLKDEINAWAMLEHTDDSGPDYNPEEEL